MWKTIKGYENYYEVNEHGEVRSLDRYITNNRGVTRFIKGKNMKKTINNQGYCVVNLRKNNTANVVPVHVLVAKAFINNEFNYPTVNHIDGDKTNNTISNLEWATYSRNNIHALEMGLRSPRGNMIGKFNNNNELISTYRSTCEAARKTGISRAGISHCINGRSKCAGGFIWKKLSESQTTIPQGSTQDDELPAEAQRPHINVEDIVCAVSNNGIER